MTYKIYFLQTILIYFLSIHLYAQNEGLNDEHKLVSKTVKTLFDGMRTGDSAAVHMVFHPNNRMYTSYMNKNGDKVLKEGNLQEFLLAIGTPHENIWDEKISNTHIQVDDDLAQVWTDYTFYIGDKFSHCGVDALQLIKDKNGLWKIINLIDTRRIKNCD